jgi:hypothetical protein
VFKPPPSAARVFRSTAEEWSGSGTPKSLIFAILSQKAAQIIKKKSIEPMNIDGEYPFYILRRKAPQLNAVAEDLLKKCEGVCR